MIQEKTLSSPEQSLLGSMDKNVDGSGREAASRPKRVVAISSGGGHWVQLLRLRKAFEGCDVLFVTVNESYRSQIHDARFQVVPDSNQWNKFSLLKTAFAVFVLMLRERPDVVISTGAAPGYFGLRIGKMFGAKTIWVDSVANAEELSLSGKKIASYADLYLTQWPHLASENGPRFAGNVLH